MEHLIKFFPSNGLLLNRFYFKFRVAHLNVIILLSYIGVNVFLTEVYSFLYKNLFRKDVTLFSNISFEEI